jgi:tetratricopeptide (TPR) repeat protein
MCTGSSILNAAYNYWNNSTPRAWADGTSLMDVSHPSSNPNYDTYQQDNLVVTDSAASLTNDNLEKVGRIDDAIAFYQALIAKNIHVEYALTKLIYLENKYGRNEITSYLEKLIISVSYQPLVQKLIANIYLQKDLFSKAISVYDNIISNYPDNREAINARFLKLFGYLNIKQDLVKANQMLSLIKSMNLKDKEWIMKLDIADCLINLPSLGMKKKIINTKINDIPSEYSLFQNYPNPFNPTTTISYSIPKAGNVSLKIFDILGKEIITLVNENKVEGNYTLNFNASNLSSGIYIYQIRTNEFILSKKMMVLK